MHAKDLSESKYEFLIKKRENARIKHLNNSNAFIEYSQSIDDIYNNIDDYNLTRKRIFLCVFDDMIADILTKTNFLAVLKELLIRCRKLNVSIVVITQSYFSVPKEVRLNSTHHLTMKMHRKESYKILLVIIQQILIIKTLWRFIANVQVNHILLTTETTLPADDPLRS